MRIFITFLLATVIGATAYAVDFRLRDFNDDDFRIAQVKTELTLVFLYNSDCDACRKGAAQIEKSATVNSLTTAKKLKVVSVAMFEDGDGWKRKAATFPDSWKHCSDAYDELMEGDALVFETVPAYFVLDAAHEVVASHVSFSAVERFLKEKLLKHTLESSIIANLINVVCQQAIPLKNFVNLHCHFNFRAT